MEQRLCAARHTDYARFQQSYGPFRIAWGHLERAYWRMKDYVEVNK